MQLLISLIYSFHMPCFFICSGYLFCRYVFSDSRKILVSVGNFSIVYILFATLFIVMSMMFTTNNHHDIHSFYCMLYGKVGPYWYLYVLAICYLLSYCCSNKLMVVLAIVLSLSTMFLFHSQFYILRKLFFHFPFFVLGGIIAHKEIKLRPIFAIVCGGLSVVMLFCFIYFHISWRMMPVVAFFLPMCLALGLWSIFEWLNIDIYLLRVCGLFSYEIYVFHSFLATPMRIFFLKLGVYPPLSVLLNLIIGCLVPILISIILKKLSLHKYIFKPL